MTRGPTSFTKPLDGRDSCCTPCRCCSACCACWPSPTAITAPSWPPGWRCSTTRRITPAHQFNDGQNYHPTNKWVLFGHHFAAISGAGPLIGPVLAIQYGYMPGLLWLVIGVCLAGAVQDMLVLAASVRRGGKSLAEIARAELGSRRQHRRVGGHPVHRHHRPGRAGLRGRQGAGRRGGQAAAGHADHSCRPADATDRRRERRRSTRSIDFPAGCTIRYDRAIPAIEPAGSRSVVRVPAGDPCEARPTGDPPRHDRHCRAGCVQLVPGSSWGTFTIACTIPIALFVGL